VGQAEQPIAGRTRCLCTTSTATNWRNIIVGASHEYGLAWLEQKADAGGSGRSRPTGSRRFGQFHTMALGDLTGDGQPDLVTANACLRITGRTSAVMIRCSPSGTICKVASACGTCCRTITCSGFRAERTLTATQRSHCRGMKLNIADMDRRRRHDIVVAGKTGLYVFYNEGTTPPGRARPASDAARVDLTSSWFDWAKATVTRLSPLGLPQGSTASALLETGFCDLSRAVVQSR